MFDNTLEVKILSSLEKVFAEEELMAEPLEKGSMLMNEIYSFQAAYKWNGFTMRNVAITVNSELKQYISVRLVSLVPCEMPIYPDHDDNVLRSAPGLFPDILQDLGAEGISLAPKQWRSLWFTVAPVGNIKQGIYPIEIIFSSTSGEILGKASFTLEIIGASLPEQKLIHTQWFHSDCISTWYGLEVFSEAYWNMVAKYVRTASAHGINMLLTPVFTPPLDTWIGGERPTVQLIDVEKTGDTYSFGFDKFKKWVEMCFSNGIKYLEISHLFTQWGAKHAPKVMATVDGEYKRIFGWDTNSTGAEYVSFLNSFLPELVKVIKSLGIQERVYFHVSDEPNIDHLEQYKKCSEILNNSIEGFNVIDALSNYEFYESGAVKRPIPATNHIEPFLNNKVKDLWAYYCCGQYKKVANRFLAMPSARNRILGVQLYKFNIVGFLQWGYNFWYSQYSKYPIDPFKVTDAGFAFPGGDAFVVYPGKEGPVSSLKFEVFYEALQDMRALELAEKLAGRLEVEKLLEEGLEEPISFSEYPKSAEWLLNKREQINALIKKELSQ